MSFSLAGLPAWNCSGLAVAFSLFAAGLVSLAPSLAQADPFAGLAGSWSGSGTLQTSEGTRERIRCRATYEVVDGGQKLQQRLRCASDSYRFDVESDVSFNKSAGLISGTWRETTRDVGGRASGPARPGQLKLKVEGTGFNAELEIVTQGDRQTVTVRAESTDVTEVLIDLRKG